MPTTYIPFIWYISYIYNIDFHKDIIYLTGTSEQVQNVAKAYRVYYSKVSLIYLLSTT